MDDKLRHQPRFIAAELAHRQSWVNCARPSQIEPDGDWSIWMIRTGRGWGKTRTAAEFVQRRVMYGLTRHIHLVGATSADARDVMVQGESGILAVSQRMPQHWRARYSPTKRKVIWPNGAEAILFSAEEPERLRGPQCDLYWCDELAAWKRLEDTWNQLMFGARLGKHVQGVVTTTPKPFDILRSLENEEGVVVTRGSTYENRDNLASNYLSRLEKAYEGTRLGRQEIYGEILDDNPDAIFSEKDIDATRIIGKEYDTFINTLPHTLNRIVVAVDPAISSSGDENGIVVSAMGKDGDVYVLEDATLQGRPAEWAAEVIRQYEKYGCDVVVYERNQGGELVEHTLQAYRPYLPTKGVWASRGKRVRAEPVATLYEKGKVHHVGRFPKLEEELTQWTPESRKSPNRMDALVWAITELTGSRIPDIVDRRMLRI